MPAQLKELTVVQLQSLLTGLPKYCSSMQLVLDSKPYTIPAIVPMIQTILDAIAAISAARASWVASIAAGKTVAAKEVILVREARDIVGASYANSPSILDALGIKPRKSPKPLSAEARLAATAKGKATRLARGTKSAKQKAMISGDVSGVTVTVTPITLGTVSATPVASTPSSSPASPVAPIGAGATAVGSTPAH